MSIREFRARFGSSNPCAERATAEAMAAYRALGKTSVARLMAQKANEDIMAAWTPWPDDGPY